jgi:hypothetical protein
MIESHVCRFCKAAKGLTNRHKRDSEQVLLIFRACWLAVCPEVETLPMIIGNKEFEGFEAHADL